MFWRAGVSSEVMLCQQIGVTMNNIRVCDLIGMVPDAASFDNLILAIPTEENIPFNQKVFQTCSIHDGMCRMIRVNTVMEI